MTTSHSHEDFKSAKLLTESRIINHKKTLKQSLKNITSYMRYEVITPKRVLYSVAIGFAFGEITKRPHVRFSKAKKVSDSAVSWITAGINIYALAKSYSNTNENSPSTLRDSKSDFLNKFSNKI
ncbi:MAG: hypothetical protein V4629_09785 [Pseudomonadota bacterium]